MSITRVAAHPADGVVDVVLLIYPPCLPPSSSPSSPVELIMSTRRRSQRAGWADDAESDRSLSLMVIMPPLFLSHSSTVTCQNEEGASQSRENVNWFDTTAARLNFFHFFPFFVTINFLTQSKHIRRRPKRVYFSLPSYLHIGLYCVDFISYSFQVDSRFEMGKKIIFTRLLRAARVCVSESSSCSVVILSKQVSSSYC